MCDDEGPLIECLLSFETLTGNECVPFAQTDVAVLMALTAHDGPPATHIHHPYTARSE